MPFWDSFIRTRPLSKKTASLIKKETDERRTSNIERPTSNNVFCQLKKDRATRGASACAARANLLFEIRFDRVRRRLRFSILRFACFKIDKAQRHQYSTFKVGRSMFDVQSVPCSARLNQMRSFIRGFKPPDWKVFRLPLFFRVSDQSPHQPQPAKAEACSCPGYV